ncbi:MAG: 50S ribosomal protein L35 [Alphaproteobacteria bacterium]|nr:MAG: 50S ribosomal protein L35 [Alphaproteobacteria bacterium]
MYKLKTKKSLAKRLIFAHGRIKRGNAFKRHNQRKRPTSLKVENRRLSGLHCSHLRTVLKALPYGGM